MRFIVLGISVVLSSFAFADRAPRVNLDQPGVLDQLKIQHPQRYRAVTALLLASEHAPCLGGEIKALQARYDVKDLECRMVVLTAYPAKRQLNFRLEGVNYAATVVLKDVDVLQPVSPTIDSPLRR